MRKLSSRRANLLHTFTFTSSGDPKAMLEADCQYQCVLQMDLNGKTLLLTAHVDAVDPIRHQEGFTDMSSFVRLKARKDSTRENADYTYRR